MIRQILNSWQGFVSEVENHTTSVVNNELHTNNPDVSPCILSF